MINYIKVTNLKSVRIINSQLNESLASLPSRSDEGKRSVFTELNPEFGNWVLENIPNSYNLCRIQTKENGEYLFASEFFEEETGRRKVLTDPLLPENLNKSADWEVKKVPDGYLIKNTQYSEYLFSDAIVDGNYNYVFTSPNIEKEAVWNFRNNFTGKGPFK